MRHARLRGFECLLLNRAVKGKPGVISERRQVEYVSRNHLVIRLTTDGGRPGDGSINIGNRTPLKHPYRRT